MQQETLFFRSLFDQAPLPYCAIDAEGRLLSVNQRWQDLLGYERHEVLGRWFGEFIGSEARETFREQFADVLADGVVRGVTLPLVTKAGRVDHALFHGQVVVDSEGRPARVQCVFYELHARDEAMETLRLSEAERMAFMESSTEGFFVLDSEFRILYINRAGADMFRTQRENIIGKRVLELSPRLRDTEPYALAQHVLKTGKPVSISEYRTPTLPGDRWYSIALFALREQLGVALRDVTERKRDEERIEHLLQRQAAMVQLTLDLGHALSLDEAHRITRSTVESIVELASFRILRYDEAKHSVFPIYAVEDGVEQDVRNPEVRLLEEVEPPVREAILTKRSLSSPEPGGSQTNDGIDGGDSDAVGNVDRRTTLLIPMIAHDDVMGVLQIRGAQGTAFDPEIIELLASLCAVAAISLDNRLLLLASRETYEGVIRALATAIELRDPYTSEHQEGVARVAVDMARRMGVPESKVRAIELAAHVHDIGKVVIPAEILVKPTALTDVQRMIVQTHVSAAHDVLKGISFPWPIDEIVVQHHERLDGSGYPAGLAGDEIWLEARILAVADVAVAMTSHRPYRPAYSIDDTIAELQRARGEQLDARSVDACIAVLQSMEASGMAGRATPKPSTR